MNNERSSAFLFRQHNAEPLRGPDNYVDAHTCVVLCKHGGLTDEAPP